MTWNQKQAQHIWREPARTGDTFKEQRFWEKQIRRDWEGWGLPNNDWMVKITNSAKTY